PFLARLACVRHAASVDSEPGSNSQDNLMRLILYSRLKTELTRDSKLAVRFLFSKNLAALRPQTDVKKTASICSAEFSTGDAQQRIRRSAHLLTIDIVIMSVKHRFCFFFSALITIA